MPRISRKDRRVQRERAQRATGRGLPAAAPEAPKTTRRGPTQGVIARSAASEPSRAGDTSESGKSWLSQWPLWMKIIGLSTLLLLAIGLWKTLTSQTGP
jgi:hypothetical protein